MRTPTERLEDSAKNIAVLLTADVMEQERDWPAGEDKDPAIVLDAVSDTLADLVGQAGWQDADHDYVRRVALDRLRCECPDATIAEAARMLTMRAKLRTLMNRPLAVRTREQDECEAMFQ